MKIFKIIKALENANEHQLELIQNILEGKEPAGFKLEEPSLLTKQQVAERLNIGRTTLWRMIKSGHIEVLEPFPNIYRIPSTEIERLIKDAKKENTKND